jgi:hypothetical protein
MTLRYAHLAPDLIDDAVKTLDSEGPAWSRPAASSRGTYVAHRQVPGANILN